MSYFHESSDDKVKQTIMEMYAKTLDDIKKDVEDMRIWLKTQPHLPQVTMTDRKIEMFLIMSKCNTDKAKGKIEMYFRIRTRFPEIFLNSHPDHDRMKQAQKVVTFVPVPKLCANMDRIVLMGVKPIDDSVSVDIPATVAHMLNVVDIRFFEDMCNGHIIIFDLKHIKISHVLKLTPMLIRTVFIIGDKALTTKVSAIHLINAPNFVDQAVFLVKSMVKPKLAERIITHKDVESAVKSLEKDCLPIDYGGNERSIAELEEIFLKKFDDYKEYFDEREEWKIDEDLLPEKFNEDSYFGYYGNFKQLQVD